MILNLKINEESMELFGLSQAGLGIIFPLDFSNHLSIIIPSYSTLQGFIAPRHIYHQMVDAFFINNRNYTLHLLCIKHGKARNSNQKILQI